MSYQTKNIIMLNNSEISKELIENIKNHFDFIDVKEFNCEFNGIIGQLNAHEIIYNCEAKGEYEKYGCNELDEVLEKIYSFEDEVIEFSKLYGNIKFVYIDVDCFGGACLYSGFAVLNGEILYQEENHRFGHVLLLKQLFNNYESNYFEPFTRDFFIKKGEISGFIYDFSSAGLYVLFKTEFTDKSKYYVDAGKNSVYLKKYDCWYLHFEEKTERKQTITGVVYNVDSFKETENLIDELFIGINYEISILNIENSITTVKKN